MSRAALSRRDLARRPAPKAGVSLAPRRKRTAPRRLAFERLETRNLLTAITDLQLLDPMPLAGDTGEKPQSKLWLHDSTWWAAVSNDQGSFVWRLDDWFSETSSINSSSSDDEETIVWQESGAAWTPVLQLTEDTPAKADVKLDGEVAHILLHQEDSTRLASIQYVPGDSQSPGTWQFWDDRPELAELPLPSVETATIDIDAAGRMWTSYQAGKSVHVHYSDAPYGSWSEPVTLADGLKSSDISLVTALPDGTVGVMWSDQRNAQFGFRVHAGGSDPQQWLPDEKPAALHSLEDGGGIANNHLNVAVASDGTLYATVKTDYSTTELPDILLLVRRPDGTWDPPYEVDSRGARPVVQLNEAAGTLLVTYRHRATRGPVVFKECDTATITCGERQTLFDDREFNNPSSTRQNVTDQLVIIASGSGELVTARLTFDVPPADEEPDADQPDGDSGPLQWTLLDPMPLAGDTGEKPQSKVWQHEDVWWAALSNDQGSFVWRLDGAAWNPVLQLTEDSPTKADVKLVGEVAHILLHQPGTTQLASIQYVPGDSQSAGTWQLWDDRPSLVDLPLPAVETVTLDVDSAGRMWVTYQDGGNIQVHASDAPYSNWSSPITLADGVRGSDISAVTALPNGSVGVLWSDQNRQQFGFRMHAGGSDPQQWLPDEQPAAQHGLNDGDGIANDHLNVAVASDGTLYATVKTGYATTELPDILLLVRRPDGTWDPPYEVDSRGARPIVQLNEAAGMLLVTYRHRATRGPVVFKECDTATITCGERQTLFDDTEFNNPSSTRQNVTDQLVVIASGNGELVTAHFTFDVPPVDEEPVDEDPVDEDPVDEDPDGDEQPLPWTLLDSMPLAGDTGEKPQSKLWHHDNTWWAALSNDQGSFVWRLDGAAWNPVLQLSEDTPTKADVKLVGDTAHILLHQDTSTQLASIQYVPSEFQSPGTWQLWDARPSLVGLPLPAVETVTLDVDSTGRMWVTYQDGGNIQVHYSDAPYGSWSPPITLASGVKAGDDISLVTALPNQQIGVLWSDQNRQRFGFRIHIDGTDPTAWLADEVPAGQFALEVGDGMADDHLNVAVASDGTLYAAVKTSYDTVDTPTTVLLVRRPDGTWDPPYEVDPRGSRPVVQLNEATGTLLVTYRNRGTRGPVVFKECDTATITCGERQTLFDDTEYNNPSSTKQNVTHELVVIASGNGELVGARFTFDVPEAEEPNPEQPEAPAMILMDPQPLAGNTGEKPQSKVWRHDNTWWATLSNDQGTFVWRLDGTAWTAVLELTADTPIHADVKPDGDVAHILLHQADTTQLASVQYVAGDSQSPGTWQFWDARPELADLPLPAAETATLDVDSTGRMWVTYQHGGDIQVHYSDVPYDNWSAPITLASGVRANDDISLVTALPGGQIGVLWSDQRSQRFGFRIHVDGTDPNLWLPDEVPAGGFALDVDGGMADDHLNVAVADDGTLFAIVKTEYSGDLPKLLLLVRRPDGTWDPPYPIDTQGTRPVVQLSQWTGNLIVSYRQRTASGPIVYRQCTTSPSTVSCGEKQVLISGGSLNNPSSTKQNFTDELVVIASRTGELEGVRLLFPTPNQAPAVSAGPDQTLSLSHAALLQGSVSDDGLPDPPGEVTVTWSVFSGPGEVVFQDPSSPQTSATFSQTGHYVLHLAAHDGELTAWSPVTVTVVEPPTNQPPLVNAGPDQTALIEDVVVLDGSVSDDGLPDPPGEVETSWSVFSGPGEVFFEDPSAPQTTATFSQTGDYVLHLVAHDGELTAWDPVTITVQQPESPPEVPAEELVVAAFQNSVAPTTNYAGTRDAWFRVSQPDTNFGASKTLELSGSSQKAALVQWDTTFIPAGSTVVSVSITVSVSRESNDHYAIYQVLQPWVESEVTWNQYAAGSPWQFAGAQGSLDHGQVVLGALTGPELGPSTLELNGDGIAVVQGWIDDPASNFGLIFQDYVDATDGLRFRSRETGTPANRPRLEIAYLPPPDNDDGEAEAEAEFDAAASSPPPWQNPANPLDVNADSWISPLDALIVINALNQHGAGPLPPLSDSQAPPPYLDTSGDNLLSALDALLVINHLNQLSADQDDAIDPAVIDELLLEMPEGESVAAPGSFLSPAVLDPLLPAWQTSGPAADRFGGSPTLEATTDHSASRSSSLPDRPLHLDLPATNASPDTSGPQYDWAPGATHTDLELLLSELAEELDRAE